MGETLKMALMDIKNREAVHSKKKFPKEQLWGIKGIKDDLTKSIAFSFLLINCFSYQRPGKDLERPSSTRLEARVPSHDSRAMTSSPSPLAWRPDFPGAPREAH